MAINKKPFTPVIEDTLDHFPSRDLTLTEKKLIIAQIIRFSTNEIASTLPIEERLKSKIIDSNLINRFISNCPDNYTEVVWIDIGSYLRRLLTNNSETLGIKESHIPDEIKPILH